MKKYRKAQIGAFIMLGLVILSIFLFLFYVRGQIQTSQAETRVDIASEVLRKMPALNYYVSLCLKDSSENALLLLGKQGGAIYNDQGGLTDINSVPVFRYDAGNVTYGITSINTSMKNAQRLMGTVGYPYPPDYPCIALLDPSIYSCTEPPYSEFVSPKLMPVKFFPFGLKNLPLLCIPGGPNDITSNIYPFPCPSGSYGPDSMQEQMEVFIFQALQNCTNFSEIKKSIPYNITSGLPNITPIIGENDIIVRATYPINITIEGYGAVRLFDFEVRIPIRLKKIYGLADFLAYNDANFIDFNLTKDYDSDVYQTIYWDPYISIEKSCPRCSQGDYTSIIQINDSASNMRGSPYYFRFASENRIPALDWIHKTDYAESFDYIMQEGDEIRIEPQGYDPDDIDELYYGYKGWKQDYDEVFDPGCCQEITGDSADVQCSVDPWPCVKRPGNPSLQMCMDDYQYIDPSKWATSSLFQYGNPNFKSANYTTKTTNPDIVSTKPEVAEANPVYYPCIKDATTGQWLGKPYSRDLGAHNVIVKVCDKQGILGGNECDWQNVTIMVTDVPRPTITITPPYTGFSYASLEDPFALDATGSCIFPCPSYDWSVYDPSGALAFDYVGVSSPKIVIPHPISNYDINIIKGAQKFFQSLGMYTINLKIGGSPATTSTIEVKTCIPLSGTSPPYPYNTVDPFMAEHRCCNSDGTLKGAGSFASPNPDKCYESPVVTGSYRYMIENSQNYLSTETELNDYPIVLQYYKNDGTIQAVTESRTNSNPFAPEKNAQNDIYKTKFERLCSGDRGNTCTGDARETRWAVARCADFEFPEQIRRCEGPATGPLTDLTCQKYTDTTFEFVYTEYGNPGINCAETQKCTDGIDYRTLGNYICQQARCDQGVCKKPVTQGCICNSNCPDPFALRNPGCDGLTFDVLNNPSNNPVGGICHNGGFCRSNCNFEGPDNSREACECNSPAPPQSPWKWNVGGEVASTTCCGNNVGTENYRYNTLDPSPDKDACCNSANECVLGGICKGWDVAAKDVCNGIDDDCNPSTADGFDETPPPSDNSNGVCLGSKKVCKGTLGWQNDYLTLADYEPIEASCNDGLDNDCDGWTDNGDDNCP